MTVSYRPEDQVAGGSIFSDADGTVTGAKWVDDWDYKGKATATVGLLLTIAPHADGSEEAEVFLAMGGAKKGEPSKFQVVDDGENIDYVEDGKDGGFGSNSNVGLFFASLEACGFPKSKFGPPVSKMLVGLQGHFVRIKRKVAEGETTDNLSFQLQKLIALPGEKGKGKTSSSSSSKGNGSVTTSATPADDALIQQIAMAVAKAGEDGIKREDLQDAIFKTFSKSDLVKQRAGALVKVNDDKFLGGLEGYTYEGSGDSGVLKAVSA